MDLIFLREKVVRLLKKFSFIFNNFFQNYKPSHFLCFRILPVSQINCQVLDFFLPAENFHQSNQHFICVFGLTRFWVWIPSAAISVECFTSGWCYSCSQFLNQLFPAFVNLLVSILCLLKSVIISSVKSFFVVRFATLNSSGHHLLDLHYLWILRVSMCFTYFLNHFQLSFLF